jgi:hypothetical protein
MFQKVCKNLELSSTAPHGLYCFQGADPVDKKRNACNLGHMGKAYRPSGLHPSGLWHLHFLHLGKHTTGQPLGEHILQYAGNQERAWFIDEQRGRTLYTNGSIGTPQLGAGKVG